MILACITPRHNIQKNVSKFQLIFRQGKNRTLRILFCCNILGTFLSKRHALKLLLMLLRIPDWFVNNVFCARYTLLLCKSGSSVVKSLLRNPWIGGSNPGGNYTAFLVSRRMNHFSSENWSFFTLNQTYDSGSRGRFQYLTCYTCSWKPIPAWED